MSNRPWLKKRRALKEEASEKYPNRPMEWIGGILYFSDTMKAVPEIRKVPKHGRRVLGLKALSG